MTRPFLSQHSFHAYRSPNRWGFYMMSAIFLQILTGWLRTKALEGKYSNFSRFHRVRKVELYREGGGGWLGLTVCDGLRHTPSDEFRRPIFRRPGESRRRATRLRKEPDDILPKPPPLLFLPRWFRRKPAQHFVPGGVLHTNTITKIH